MNIKMFNGNNLPGKRKTNLRNAFESNMSTDIKLPKAQISKITQSGGFLGSLLSKIAGPLMKVTVPLAKNILAPLGITATTLAIDAEYQKKIHGSGTTTLTISKEEINNIIKVVQALENFSILWKELLKQLKMKQKKQKSGFLGMFLDTLGAILLVNMIAGKGILWK